MSTFGKICCLVEYVREKSHELFFTQRCKGIYNHKLSHLFHFSYFCITPFFQIDKIYFPQIFHAPQALIQDFCF